MKRKLTGVALAMLASILLFSCNQPEKSEVKEVAKPTFDLATAKTEIEAVNKTFMEYVAKKDTVGIAGLYTSDARVMFTGAPAVEGKANIQSLFSQMLNSPVTKVNLETVAVYGTEELVAEEGKISIYVGDKVVAEEKCIVLWKKEDGKWKLFRDIANSNSK